MYSSLQRLNNISTFVTTCLLALLAAISLSSFILATNTSGSLNVSPVKMSGSRVPGKAFYWHTIGLVLFEWIQRDETDFALEPAKGRSSTIPVRFRCRYVIFNLIYIYYHILTSVGRVFVPTCNVYQNFALTRVDLRSLFHWNTKQVFLYLSAEYTNRQGVREFTQDRFIWVLLPIATSFGSLRPDFFVFLFRHHQLQNEVVIWDRIVRRRQDARVRIENGQNKYFFKEHSGSFRWVSSIWDWLV